MSVMSDLSLQIQDLLHRGFSPEKIASLLEIPVGWVYEIETELEQGY